MSTKSAVATKRGRLKVTAKKNSSPQVSEKTIKELTGVFGLLADKSRLKILLALSEAGEMHVNALCELLGQSQPAVSHHLTLLKGKELVDFRRDGKHNFYRIESERVRIMLEQFFTDTGNDQQQLRFPDFSLAYKSNGAKKR